MKGWFQAPKGASELRSRSSCCQRARRLETQSEKDTQAPRLLAPGTLLPFSPPKITKLAWRTAPGHFRGLFRKNARVWPGDLGKKSRQILPFSGWAGGSRASAEPLQDGPFPRNPRKRTSEGGGGLCVDFVVCGQLLPSGKIGT